MDYSKSKGVRISGELYDFLCGYGKKGESFDKVIKRIIEESKKGKFDGSE